MVCKAGTNSCELFRDHVFLFDQEGRISSCTPGGPLGSRAVGKRLDEVVHAEHADYVLEQARRVFVEGSGFRWLTQYRGDRSVWLTQPVVGNVAVDMRPFAIAVSRTVCPFVFDLSPRQRDILFQLTLDGCTKKVAKSLAISLATVHSHLKRAQLAAQRMDFIELLTWAKGMQHCLTADAEICEYLSRLQG
jgi:hypothetical protein